MIPRGCESRDGTPITLIAIHTAEGATNATSLANYLDGPEVEASYHKLVDNTQVITYLRDETQAAWAMLSGNHRSVQLCFTGFAAWPASEWLAHDHMLRLGAIEVAKWCVRYSIPATHLTPTQISADWWGICGHWDWTLGKREGTHTDPGPNFPWTYFISLVRDAIAATRSPEDTMPWRLERTQSKMLSKAGDHPDASWSAVEDVVTLPGPAGGWHGRMLTHTVLGYGGGFIQEAWWGGLPSAVHVVKPDAPTYAPAFIELAWEAPAGARWLTIRYAAPAGGSIGIETEH